MSLDGPRRGERGALHWACSPNGSLPVLLRRCPELVVGKFVAVTSFDSGPLRLGPRDIAAGWRSDGDVAYSPRVQAIEQLGTGEWDEWYVLDAPRRLPPLEVFVNYGGFTPEPTPNEIEPGSWWDPQSADSLDQYVSGMAERFWAQLQAIRPFGYVAEGDALTVVAADGELVDRVLAAMRATD